MNFERLFMGLLQGFTEFLPVSSSGHLGLAKMFFNINEPNLAYDLVLHAATLLAVLLYFWRDICHLLFEWVCAIPRKSARAREGWRYGWAVIAGLIVTAPFGVFLRSASEAMSVNSLWLAGGFWVTSLLLFSTRFLSVGVDEVAPRHGFFIGLLQGIAVMPGISRSGSTIWAGLLSGLSREEAFRFSFLLSVPTILGAVLMEARHLGGSSEFFHALPEGWLWGTIASFCAGMLSLVMLRKLVTGDKFWVFAIYCLLLGCVSMGLFLVGV